MSPNYQHSLSRELAIQKGLIKPAVGTNAQGERRASPGRGLGNKYKNASSSKGTSDLPKQTKPTRPKKHNGPQRPKGEEFRCPYCSKKISPVRFEAHLRKCQEAPFCRYCGKNITVGSVIDHIRGCRYKPYMAVKKKSTSPVPLPSSGLSERRPFVHCEICDQKVYTDKLALHHANIHSVASSAHFAVPVSTFPFQLLPNGTQRSLLEQHYAMLSRKRTSPSAALDWERLRILLEMKPVRIHLGSGAWSFYAAYEFGDSHPVVLESLAMGHAIYVFKENWMKMIHRTKAEVRKEYSEEYTRIYHVGDWRMKLKDSVLKSS